MISLAPVSDVKKTQFYFEKVGIEFNANSQCVLCSDGQSVLGFCLFDMDKHRIIINHIEPTNDIPLADGILRSTLHVAAERSIMDAFYADTLSEAFLEKINFIKNREEKRLDIDKLFKSCCSCTEK